MKIKKNRLNEMAFILYIFGFIFAPPIFPKINFIYIIFIYSFLKIIIMRKKIVSEVFLTSKIKRFCTGMSLAYLYVLIIMVLVMPVQNAGFINYLKTIYRFILITPVTITCIMYIIIRAKQLNYDIYDIINAIIKAGMIQAIISIMMFLSPTIKEKLVQIMFNNTGDSITQNLWVYQRRLYAFSNSVLDSFGYGTGILAALPFYLAYKSKIRYLFYIPILLIVPLLNSRTGLLIFSIGFVCSIPIYITRMRIIKLLKIIGVILIIIISLSGVYKIVYNVNPTTVTWVENGISDFISIFNKSSLNNNAGYKESTSVLFSKNKWYLPNGLGLILGTGHNVYEANGFEHSDVGYINDIWLFGAIGIVLFYSQLFMLLIGTKKIKKDRELKFLFYFLGVAFLVANIKGYMLNYNVGMAVTLAIGFSVTYFCNFKEN